MRPWGSAAGRVSRARFHDGPGPAQRALYARDLPRGLRAEPRWENVWASARPFCFASSPSPSPPPSSANSPKPPADFRVRLRLSRVAASSSCVVERSRAWPEARAKTSAARRAVLSPGDRRPLRLQLSRVSLPRVHVFRVPTYRRVPHRTVTERSRVHAPCLGTHPHPRERARPRRLLTAFDLRLTRRPGATTKPAHTAPASVRDPHVVRRLGLSDRLR